MKKRKFILRIIATYVVVLLPIMVVSLFVTRTLLQSVEEEELNRIRDQVTHVSQALEEDYQRYTIKSVGLLQHQQLSAAHIMREPLGQLDAINLLQKLRLFDDRAEEILIYFGEGFFYGNSGVTSPAVYFRKTLACNSKCVSEALTLIASPSIEATVLDSVSGDVRVMYHIPTGRDAQGNACSVQYIFKISSFEKIIESSLETDELLLNITFGCEDIYFYNNEVGCRALSEKQAKELLEGHLNRPLNDVDTYANSKINVWYSKLRQTQGIQQLRNTSVFILMAGLFLSTVISFGLSTTRIRSVSMLADRIVEKKLSGKKKKNWMPNEFDYIQALVDESIKDSKLVKQNMRSYRTNYIRSTAMMIFHGVLCDKADIESILSICGLEPVEDYYYICGIKLKKAEDIAKLEAYMQEDLHYVEENNFIVTLCQLRSPDYSMDERTGMAQRLRSTLDSVDISCEQIFLSQAYSDISMLNYAYLEVQSLLEHQDATMDVLCWEDLLSRHDQNILKFENDRVQMFFDAVEKKDRATAERVLDRLFSSHFLDTASDDSIRYMRYMVTQAVRLGTRTFFDENNMALLYKISDIELVENIEFVAAVKDVLKEYFIAADDTCGKILKYVDENYTSFDLSLSQIAEFANVSKSQMSKIFRAETGVGYIEYVTNLRMEKAKELLACTDMSVKDIFCSVGYVDSTNASKKFKAMYGVNPSAYRAQMQDHHDAKPDNMDE